MSINNKERIRKMKVIDNDFKTEVIGNSKEEFYLKVFSNLNENDLPITLIIDLKRKIVELNMFSLNGKSKDFISRANLILKATSIAESFEDYFENNETIDKLIKIIERYENDSRIINRIKERLIEGQPE